MKKLLIAACIGAAVAGIPFLMMYFFSSRHAKQYQKERNAYREELEKIQNIETCVLKNSVLEGEKIKEKDIDTVFLFVEENQFVETVRKEDFIGKYARVDLSKGTVLNLNLCKDGEKLTKDMRIQDFSYITIPDYIKSGEYVDVRIVFPNGEDYLVVRHKKVLENIYENAETATGSAINPSNATSGIQPSSLQNAERTARFCVTEEEILRLASGYVDSIYYEGTMIYVNKYVDSLQESGEANYPVNPDVFRLLGWDPNIWKAEISKTEKEKREILERHLNRFQREKERGGVLDVSEQAYLEESDMTDENVLETADENVQVSTEDSIIFYD